MKKSMTVRDRVDVDIDIEKMLDSCASLYLDKGKFIHKLRKRYHIIPRSARVLDGYICNISMPRGKIHTCTCSGIGCSVRDKCDSKPVRFVILPDKEGK